MDSSSSPSVVSVFHLRSASLFAGCLSPVHARPIQWISSIARHRSCLYVHACERVCVQAHVWNFLHYVLHTIKVYENLVFLRLNLVLTISLVDFFRRILSLYFAVLEHKKNSTNAYVHLMPKTYHLLTVSHLWFMGEGFLIVVEFFAQNLLALYCRRKHFSHKFTTVFGQIRLHFLNWKYAVLNAATAAESHEPIQSRTVVEPRGCRAGALHVYKNSGGHLLHFRLLKCCFSLIQNF